MLTVVPRSTFHLAKASRIKLFWYSRVSQAPPPALVGGTLNFHFFFHPFSKKKSGEGAGEKQSTSGVLWMDERRFAARSAVWKWSHLRRCGDAPVGLRLPPVTLLNFCSKEMQNEGRIRAPVNPTLSNQRQTWKSNLKSQKPILEAKRKPISIFWFVRLYFGCR